MLQLDPNGTQHKKFNRIGPVHSLDNARQRDKVTKPTRTPFPGSYLSSERAESDNKFSRQLATMDLNAVFDSSLNFLPDMMY